MAPIKDNGNNGIVNDETCSKFGKYSTLSTLKPAELPNSFHDSLLTKLMSHINLPELQIACESEKITVNELEELIFVNVVRALETVHTEQAKRIKELESKLQDFSKKFIHQQKQVEFFKKFHKNPNSKLSLPRLKMRTVGLQVGRSVFLKQQVKHPNNVLPSNGLISTEIIPKTKEPVIPKKTMRDFQGSVIILDSDEDHDFATKLKHKKPENMIQCKGKIEEQFICSRKDPLASNISDISKLALTNPPILPKLSTINISRPKNVTRYFKQSLQSQPSLQNLSYSNNLIKVCFTQMNRDIQTKLFTLKKCANQVPGIADTQMKQIPETSFKLTPPKFALTVTLEKISEQEVFIDLKVDKTLTADTEEVDHFEFVYSVLDARNKSKITNVELIKAVPLPLLCRMKSTLSGCIFSCYVKAVDVNGHSGGFSECQYITIPEMKQKNV